MNIIITGAGGQLGQSFQHLQQDFAQHRFFFFNRAELDIADSEAIKQALKETDADCLVNCAAYTGVDKAETDFDNAVAINSTAAAAMAKACGEQGTKFIHISTDYVFSGEAQEPYKEEDKVQPVNTYGRSKQMGEDAVLQANSNAVIIRTSWVYAPWGANFVKTMVRLMNSRPEVGVVADQWGSPTYAPDLAEAILNILNAEWTPGIYHFSNEGNITWFDFANAIKAHLQSDCVVKSLTTEQYPTPAKRPHYSVMSKEKIKQTFGIELKPWQESLAVCMRQL